MCIFKKPDTSFANQTVPQPEPTADPAKVGDSRKAEDKALYGETGQPQTRVSRNGVPSTVSAGGSGLKLM